MALAGTGRHVLRSFWSDRHGKVLVVCAAVPTAAPPGARRQLPAGISGLPSAFWALWSGQLVNRLGTFVEPFLVLYLTQARGFSVAAAGGVLTVYGAGSLISQPVGGLLADRIGRRPVLCLGLASNAAANVFLGLSAAPWLIVTAAALTGLTADLYRPAAQALTADLVPPERRRAAFGALFWAVNLGFAVATSLAGFLASRGYLLLFVGDAATSAAAVLIILRWIPSDRRRRSSDRAGESGPSGRSGGLGGVVARSRSGLGLDGLRIALGDRVLLAASGLTLLFATVYGQVFVTLPLAVREAGLPTTVFGAIAALNGLLIVLVQPFVLGRLNRWPRAPVLAASQLVVGLGFGLTAFAHSTPAFVATVMVWTAGEIGNAGLMNAVIADIAPAHLRGRYVGVYGLAWGGAATLAPAVGTGVYGSLGPGWLWTGCAVTGVLLAAGQLWLGRVLTRSGRLQSP